MSEQQAQPREECPKDCECHWQRLWNAQMTHQEAAEKMIAALKRLRDACGLDLPLPVIGDKLEDAWAKEASILDAAAAHVVALKTYDREDLL